MNLKNLIQRPIAVLTILCGLLALYTSITKAHLLTFTKWYKIQSLFLILLPYSIWLNYTIGDDLQRYETNIGGPTFFKIENNQLFNQTNLNAEKWKELSIIYQW